MSAETGGRLRPGIVGALIGALFGGGWAVAASISLRPEWRNGCAWLSALITAGLVVGLLTHGGGGQAGYFRGGVYGIAVGLDVVAIAVASALLKRFGASELLFPVVGIIVGLHFLGLWRATGLRLFMWVAVAMCAVCAIAAVLPGNIAGLDPRRVVAGYGCALVLWIAAATSLF